MTNLRRKYKVLFMGGITTLVAFMSCRHNPYVLPVSDRSSSADICFERDILPVLMSNCAKSGCHNGSAHSEAGGWAFNNYDNIIRGVVPGNIAASKIYQVITGMSGKKMPPAPNPALSPAQINIISKWIATGAVDAGTCTGSCDTGVYTYSAAIAPMMRNYCTGCHYTGATAVGKIILDNYGSVSNAVADSTRFMGALRHTSGYIAMPETGNQLSDCQLTQIEKWIRNGAQNN